MGCGSSSSVTSPKRIPSPQNVPDLPYSDGNATKPPEYILPPQTASNLPPPRPPDKTKDEILQNGEATKSQLDPRNIAPTNYQSLSDFTNNVLLPTSPVTIPQRSVTFSEENTESPVPNSNGFVPQPSPIPPAVIPKPPGNAPPGKPTDGAAVVDLSGSDYEGQVQKHLEELQEMKQQAEERLQLGKLKQQQTLQDKLKERNERKKKERAEAEAGGAGAGAGEGEGGDVAAVDYPQAQPDESKQAVLRDLTLDLSASPAPQPAIPETKKEALYSKENIELFGDLENFAVSMEKMTSESFTFAMLMENLLIVQLSDLEKVRILFHWITAQDLNSINFPSQIAEDTPLGFLLAIKESRKTYASLFVRLCGAAGLHAKMITGYLKGVGYYPDYKFGGREDPFRGSWNAVLIDGQWRLIDTNWGARHVTEENDTSISAWKTEYKYEEHYFLTDPDLLINTHFPDELDWQLLHRKMTIKEFEDAAKLWPLFYKLKLDLISHKFGVIEADKTGYVKIQLKVSPFARTDAKFKMELKPRDRGMEKDFPDLQKQVFHHTNIDVETFEIFLPKPGQYLLKIFALSTQYSDEGIFTNICLHQINCSKISSKPNATVHPPFPVISSFYGISVVSSQLIARPLTHFDTIVECDENGQAKISFQVVSLDPKIAFTQDLYDTSQSSNNSSSSLRNCVIHSTSSHSGPKVVTFFLRVPQTGNYALSLFSNANDTSSNSFTPFCFYLVVSNKQRKNLVALPPVPNNKSGLLSSNFDDQLLQVVSCYPADKSDWQAGLLHTDANGECTILLSHPHPLTVIAELTNSASDNVSDYVSVETTGRLTALNIRPPNEGADDAVFCLKIYAAEVNQAKNLPSVFVALVFSKSGKQQIPPLPQCPIRSWGPAGVSFVKNGLKSVSYRNSSCSLSDKFNHPDLANHGPSRAYAGGDDFEVEIQMSAPLQIKAKLQRLDDSAESNFDNYILLQKSEASSSLIRIRFIQSGSYSLVIYGCSLDDESGQLSPLDYSLISVSKPSSSTSPFPMSFAVWGSSARYLYSPLSLQLSNSAETVIKIFLGKYEFSNGDWSVKPYPEVMAVADGNKPVSIGTSNGCEYQWKYMPGPGEKVLGILVKTEEGSQSMTYALQFQIS